MKPTMKECDAVLEPELRELCGELNAIERARAAEKFMRWADQLTRSVVMMDPQLIPRVPPPQVPRGFFLLNLRKRQQAELRTLAHECDCDLRTMLHWAITTVRVRLEEHLRVARLCGVKPHECWKFTEGREQN